ncbi:DUF3450 domain-containing protein [bacterium]|nr:DUF3450 domain-containing protein [bacterium]MBU1919409.1 DUF3450 domain-containing protein [bacterium]
MKALQTRHQRGGVTLVVTIAVAVIVAAILVVHFLSRMKPPEVKTFQELVTRVETLNSQISDREQSILQLVSKYNESHPGGEIDTTGMSSMGMSDDQAELLAARVAEEKDISYRGMLQDIIDLNAEIGRIGDEMEEIRSRLRPPHAVQEGDSHIRISLDFLTSEIGLSEEEALRLIEREAMIPELMPGFEVWNYYGEGVFGTFVTQGTAKVSPNELRRATKRRIDAERQNLIQARNQKQQEVDELEARKTELLQQLRNLEEERQAMMSQMTQMAESNDSLAAELNSLHYFADTFRNLEQRGAIRKPALGKWQTGDIQAVTLHSAVDLRLEDRFVVTASSVGLEKISKVLVFPRYFKDNSDYRVEISDDKTSATVILQRPEKFSLAQLIVALN